MVQKDNRNGFSLIELLIVLLVISTILIFAVEQYKRYVEDAKISRAMADLDELVKSVRLYNIREGKGFAVATFSIEHLGSFVGTYLEKEPPKDPWGNFYQHSTALGAIYSLGPNGYPDVLAKVASGPVDDVVVRYLPEKFFITKAEFVDANLNNLIDFGDYIDVKFSRPAIINDPVVMDFETYYPERALGSAVVSATSDEYVARISFVPPGLPNIELGETIIQPREFIGSIIDKSPAGKKLERSRGVKIIKKRK